MLTILLGMMPMTSVHAASKAKQIALIEGGQSKTVKIDMTGDGKKNVVKLKAISDPADASFVKSFQMTVDGKSAISMKNISKYDAFDINLYYMKLDKNNVLIQMMMPTYNDYISYNKIYKYNKKTGKLEAIKSLNDGMSQEVASYTKDSITINESYQSNLTGWGNWKYTYQYQNGKLTLKNRVANYTCGLKYSQIGDGYDEYFKQGKYVAAKEMTFYTTKDCNDVAFTVQDGDVLTIKRIYTKTYSDLRFSFVNSEGIEGWIKVPNDDYEVINWFYGVINRMAG